MNNLFFFVHRISLIKLTTTHRLIKNTNIISFYKLYFIHKILTFLVFRADLYFCEEVKFA